MLWLPAELQSSSPLSQKAAPSFKHCTYRRLHPSSSASATACFASTAPSPLINLASRSKEGPILICGSSFRSWSLQAAISRVGAFWWPHASSRRMKSSTDSCRRGSEYPVAEGFRWAEPRRKLIPEKEPFLPFSSAFTELEPFLTESFLTEPFLIEPFLAEVGEPDPAEVGEPVRSVGEMAPPRPSRSVGEFFPCLDPNKLPPASRDKLRVSRDELLREELRLAELMKEVRRREILRLPPWEILFSPPVDSPRSHMSFLRTLSGDTFSGPWALPLPPLSFH